MAPGFDLGARRVGSSFLSERTGTFVGRITDKTGAMIPGAAVVLTAESTNTARRLPTSTDGEYSFSSVEPGVYRLEISSPGFRPSILSHINLDADQTVREDVSPEIGDANSTVVVNAVSPSSKRMGLPSQR
jgi:hypothetical protein